MYPHNLYTETMYHHNLYTDSTSVQHIETSRLDNLIADHAQPPSTCRPWCSHFNPNPTASGSRATMNETSKTT